MKKQLLLFLLSVISFLGFAQQTPFNGFNYQGVVRDANGKGFDAQNIGVKFELFNHITGVWVYSETINTTTNKFGLFTHVLGGQAPLQFAGLPWASGIDLEVSVDTAGGVSYVVIGPKIQFEGVPFSLFSYASFLDWNRSGNAAGVGDFLGTTNLVPLVFKTNSVEAMRIDINQNVGIGNNPNSKLDVNGDIRATDSIVTNTNFTSGSYVNSTNGYKYKNSAVSGKYLRGNGSYFVPDSIKLSDLPLGVSLWTNTGGTVFPNNITDKVNIGGNVAVIPNLQVSGNDGAWFKGTHGSGTTWNANAGSWMIWYPKKSAFRAGAVNGTQWNDVFLGGYSAALGYNPTASGDSSIALGNTPTASGLASIAIGSKTKATGINSLAMGYRSEALGLFSYSFGFFSKANNQGSVAIGANAISNANNAIALGQNVTASALNNFAIGSGVNAVTPLNNSVPNSIEFGMNSNLPTMHISPASGVNGIGRVGIGTTSPSAPLTVVGTVNDTMVGRFNGSNIFGTGVLINNTVNSASAVVLKSSSMSANLAYFPTPVNRLMVENINPGGHVIIETTQKIKLNADTISFHGPNGFPNKMLIDNIGRVGIGTTTPSQLLDVNGSVNISGGNSNELNRTQTTNANLVPIAYGNVNANGTVNTNGSTSNFSVQKTGTGTYEVTVTGEGITNTGYVAILTNQTGTIGHLSWVAGGSSLGVRTFSTAIVPIDMSFVFVLYKK